MTPLSPLFAPHFVATRSEQEIVERLREDEDLINAGKPCSWVAWHLPGYDTEKGFAIASELAPIPNLSHDLKSLIYENLLRKIQRYLDDGGDDSATNREAQEMRKAQESLHPSDLSTALRVLTHLEETFAIQRDTPAEIIRAWLKQRLAPQAHATLPLKDESSQSVSTSPSIPKPPPIPRKRCCYICRLALTHPHPAQPSMCIPCGSFNLASSKLSTPPKFCLPSTFTALVTGARINLGYHTALRLLRCGARVLATTRYPRDAVARYLKESDAHAWRGRLRVIGADFRCAADAFALVGEAKRHLSEWADGGETKLDLLVNNAAQTLTDGVRKEERAVEREAILGRGIENESILIEGPYKVRVRGGAVPMMLEDVKKLEASYDSTKDNVEVAGTVEARHAPNGATTTGVELYTKSSWVQSLFEIPYEDVISAHAVNTFVPLILCRELLPLMGYSNSSNPSTSLESPTKTSESLPSKPQAYIINVSSREGIFEDHTDSAAKRGKHVHTNMSKAALNMITETEAAAAWQSRRVAMNTVDPGYMSAAPEYEDAFDGVRPIGWEDGAGRVLWPVAVGEMHGEVIWGRFLKHYGAVHVDPGAGRG